MSMVDNRVVRMTFDNSNFNTKIKDTIKSINEFEQKLKFDGAATGFDAIKNAAEKLDLSILGGKASAESKKVESASTEAASSLGKIGDSANNVDFSGLGKSANSAVSDVNNAAMGVDMSPVDQQTQNASNSFNAFEEIAVGALRRIGEEITNFITGGLSTLGNKFKEFAIDPIIDGFKEYETQVGSIQTILANTGLDFDSDEDIGRVNDALDELNKYADDTVYKFTDMTEAIGTFTASGLGLEDAVAAVKGTANVAAFSGADASDVHRVLPQIAQALSAGVVSLQDWRSIETAHMASRGFVDTIGTIASHMSSIGKASAAAGEAGQALVDHSVTMRQALNQKDNEDWAKWLTSDILSESLKVFTYDLRGATKEEEEIVRNHLAELGFQDKAEQDALLRQAEMATRAATEVRTWSQLWDTFGESIGSNWSGIWRNLLGDFKQSTDTFTFLSNTMSDGVDSLLGGIVNAAKTFNESGAIDIIFGGYKRYTKEDFLNGTILDEELIGKKATDAEGNLIRVGGALDNLITAISKPLRSIGDAFNEVFNIGDEQLAETLVGLAMAFNDFTSSLIISDDAATGIREIFEGLFSIIDIGVQVVLDIGAAFFELVDIVRTVTDPLIDIALVLGGQVGKALLQLHDYFLEIRGAVIYALKPFGDILEVVKEVIRAFFGFVDIPGKIEFVGDSLLDFIDILWRIIDIPGKIAAVGDFLKGIFDFIADLTGWSSAVEEVNRHFDETGEKLNIVDVWFKRLLDNPVIGFFSGIKDSILNAFPPLREFFGALTDDPAVRDPKLAKMWNDIAEQIKATLKPLGDFMGALWNGIKTTAGFIGRLAFAIGGFAVKLGEAFLSWEPIQKIIGKLNEFKDGAINFFLSLPDRIGGMIGGLSGSLGGVQGVFDGVFKWFEDTIKYFSTVSVDQFLNDLSNWANGIIENVKNVFNYLTTTDPSKMAEDFKNSVQGFIDSIDEVILGFIGSIGNPQMAKDVLEWYKTTIFRPFMDAYDSFTSWISDIASKSKSVPEFFVNVFSSIKDSISNKIGEIKSAFENFDFKTWFAKSRIDLTEAASNVYQSIYDMADNIENTFPALDGVLTGGLGGIKSKLKEFSDGFFDFMTPIVNSSDSIPDFFVKLFTAIYNKIKEGVKNAFDALSSFTPNVFKGWWSGFSDTIKGIIDNLFPGLSPATSEALGTLDGFFGESVNEATNWGDIFSNIVSSIPGVLSNAFGNIVDAIINGLKFITGELSNIPGPFGEIFKSINQGLSDTQTEVVNAAKNLPTKFAEMFGSVKTFVDDALNNLSRFWNGFKIEEVPDSAGGIVEQFKAFIGEKINGIKDSIMNLPNTFKELLDKFNEILNSDTVNRIVDIIEKVLIGRLLYSGADFVQGLGKLAGGVGTYLARKNWQPLSEQVYTVAKAIGILCASIWLISTIEDPQAAMNILYQVVGLLAVLMIVGGKLEQAGVMVEGKNLLQVAASVAVFAYGLVKLMEAIEKLSQFKIDENGLGIVLAAVTAIFACLSDIMIGKLGGSGDIIKVAGAIVIFAFGLMLMSPAIQMLSQITPEQLEGAARALIVILGAFAILVKTVGGMDVLGNEILKIAASVVIFSVGIYILANALNTLADKDFNTVGQVGIILDTLVGVFIGLVATAKALNAEGKEVVQMAAGVLIFSIGIVIMAESLKMLAEVDPVVIGVAAGAMDTMVGVFIGLIATAKKLDAEGKEVIQMAAGVLIFSIGIIIMSESLKTLSEVDPVVIAVAAGAMDTLVGVFIGLVATAKALSAEGKEIIAMAAGVIVFSVGIIILANALKMLAEVDPVVIAVAAGAMDTLVGVFIGLVAAAKALGASGADVIMMGAGVIVFSIGIMIIANALAQLAGVDIASLAAATIAIDTIIGLFGALAVILSLPVLAEGAMVVLPLLALAFISVGVAAYLIAEALNLAVDAISKLVDNGPALASFVELIASHILEFGEAAIALGALGIALVPLGTGLLLFGAGALVAGVGLLSLSMGIREFLTLIPELPELVQNAMNAINDFITHLPERFGEIWNNITTWFNETVIPAVVPFIQTIFTKIGEFLSTLGEWWETTAAPAIMAFIEQLGAWWNETALPAIMAFIDQFGTWWNETALPAIMSFFQMVGTKIGEFLAWFGEWFVNEGIPKIQELAGKLWNWLTNTAIPKLGEFVEMLMGKLGELLSKFGNWFVNEGLPALIKAGGDIANWFFTTAIPKLGDFINMIFAKLGELLGQLATWVLTEGVPAAGKALMDILAKLGEFGPQLLEWASGLPQHILDGIAQVLYKFAEAGENIVIGIKDGILGGVQWVVNAMGDLGQAAVDAVKNFFGIHSPSTLMRDDVGQYIPAGLAEGVDMNSGEFYGSMEKMGAEGVKVFAKSASSNMKNFDLPLDQFIQANDIQSLDGVAEWFAHDQFKRAGVITDNKTKNTTQSSMQNSIQSSTKSTITPVLDKTSSNSMDINSTVKAVLNSDDFASKLKNEIRAGIEGSGTLDRLEYQTSGLSSEIGMVSNRLSTLESFLNDKLISIIDKLDNPNNVYLDSGTLVGAIAPQMDDALGKRQIYAQRGMI